MDTILSGGKIDIAAIDYLGVPQAVNVAYNNRGLDCRGYQTALNARLNLGVACAVTIHMT